MTKSIFIKHFSATVQFILGFILGIGVMAGISGTIIFAYYAKMSAVPKKPVFPEPIAEQTAPSNTADIDIEPIEPLESTTKDSLESEETTPPAEDAKAEVELPPNAYRASVTWPEGLSLRAEPDADAERIGGIENKAMIIILEDSADGQWQRVRLPWNDQEGWIKGGNTQKTP
jgi:hypothetical protein